VQRIAYHWHPRDVWRAVDIPQLKPVARVHTGGQDTDKLVEHGKSTRRAAMRPRPSHATFESQIANMPYRRSRKDSWGIEALKASLSRESNRDGSPTSSIATRWSSSRSRFQDIIGGVLR
jgi:hypothetical protein